MKKIAALMLALFTLIALCGCGSKPQSEPQAYADQGEFLKAMAKGISTRLKHVDNAKEHTPEEEAAYYAELVNYELKEISKYDTFTFRDDLFNELAHAYINGCKMQLLSAQNYKNSNLYKSLWSAGSSARNSIIVELYSRYDLPLTGEEAAQYSVGGSSNSVAAGNANSSGTTNKNTPYVLGTAVTGNYQQGKAAISLDKVETESDSFTLTATNQGEIGFASSGSIWTYTFYDSDGYAFKEYSSGLNDTPLKPGKTVKYTYSFRGHSGKIAYISIDSFFSMPSSENIRLVFHYAFDLSGKQVDYDSLVH